MLQGKIRWFIPTTICGVTVLVAGLLILLQPETKGKHLTDHIEEEEKEEETTESETDEVEMHKTKL